mmetsp:Transcript_79616/g.200259  ORF Transcript_79616/g.200259 Transcript_79616/m.200259 type:complete len:218 (-) Transcript_79616:9-662(-)
MRKTTRPRADFAIPSCVLSSPEAASTSQNHCNASAGLAPGTASPSGASRRLAKCPQEQFNVLAISGGIRFAYSLNNSGMLSAVACTGCACHNLGGGLAVGMLSTTGGTLLLGLAGEALEGVVGMTPGGTKAASTSVASETFSWKPLASKSPSRGRLAFGSLHISGPLSASTFATGFCMPFPCGFSGPQVLLSCTCERTVEEQLQPIAPQPNAARSRC